MCKRCESKECSKIKGFEQLVNANLQHKNCYKLNNDKGLQGIDKKVKSTDKAENPTKSRVFKDCKKIFGIVENDEKKLKSTENIDVSRFERK